MSSSKRTTSLNGVKILLRSQTKDSAKKELLIRIYNGFAEKADLRQTGISENLATFGQK